MNDTLILIISIFISAILSGYIGFKFSQLKNKSDNSALVERQNQLNNTIENLKETISKTENEREAIRCEKEFLNTELSIRNTELQNLQKQQKEHETFLAKEQEQLRKDFEIMASKNL